MAQTISDFILKDIIGTLLKALSWFQESPIEAIVSILILVGAIRLLLTIIKRALKL